MVLHCYAMIPDDDEKRKLADALRRRSIKFLETSAHISVELECLSYRTAEQIISLFEERKTNERGFSMLGCKGEIPCDTI